MNIGKFISIIHRKRQLYIKEKMKELNLDIGISDYPVILILNSRGKLGTTEIARHHSLTNSQVSQSLRRLEKLGYITQERNKEYRHKVIVDITPEGLEIAKILKKITKSWQEIAEEDIAVDEMQGLQDLLVKVAINVSEEDITPFIGRALKKKSKSD